jgi:hypothetical protein
MRARRGRRSLDVRHRLLRLEFCGPNWNPVCNDLIGPQWHNSQLTEQSNKLLKCPYDQIKNDILLY